MLPGMLEVDAMTRNRRPSPFGELVTLRQAMDRLFDDTMDRPFAGFGWTKRSTAPVPTIEPAESAPTAEN